MGYGDGTYCGTYYKYENDAPVLRPKGVIIMTMPEGESVLVGNVERTGDKVFVARVGVGGVFEDTISEAGA